MIKKLSYATAVLIVAASLPSCSAPATLTESCAEFRALVASVPFNEDAKLRSGIKELDSRGGKLHDIVREPIQEMAKTSKETTDNSKFLDGVLSPLLDLTDKCDL